MATDIEALATVADYQFGAGAGKALFEGDLVVQRTGSGRPQQILAEGDRVVSYGTDGRFTLGVAGGRRLRAALDPPASRVIVGNESAPFLRDGRNVFAKFVQCVDPAIRPGDEVVVEHHGGDLLAVGRAELSATAMDDFDTGMAIKVRNGVPE